MSFVERHGLWSERAERGGDPPAPHRRRTKTRNHPAVVSRPARHPARQDAGRERSAGLAGKRLHHHHDDARQGHRAPHGVSGVHLRRRLRHARDGRRRRRADGGRSHELSRAAVGARHRLAAVRRVFRRRTAGAVRDPASVSQRCSTKLGQRGSISSPASKSNFTSSSSKTPGCRRKTRASPASRRTVSLLSHGYQYLTEQRYDQMEPVLDIIRRDILALGLPLRSVEVEFGPSQCEFTFTADARGLSPPTTWCCFAAP